MPAVSGVRVQLTLSNISKCALFHPGCSKNLLLMFNLILINSSHFLGFSLMDEIQVLQHEILRVLCKSSRTPLSNFSF